jgi:stearoyl-CoA desaturase (delta-9 desaturase)
MSPLVATLVMTHITIVCVTLYLHRGMAHRSVEFHPVIAHAMRFWLWLTTGMVTQQWVAVHRKHHRFSDQPGDPHSPHVYGLGRVFFKGAVLYHEAAKDKIMVDAYGRGTPADWVELHLYQPYSRLGIGILLVLNTVIFGWWGLVVWGVQMIWIPLWAAGVVNGVGHWWGYCNGITKDRSQNLVPWGILIGGEELHNNHHLAPASACLSKNWWEFDIGWMYITIFRSLGLAKLKV